MSCWFAPGPEVRDILRCIVATICFAREFASKAEEFASKAEKSTLNAIGTDLG
ncbi:hypothetical protein P3T23_002952 [Paraburkholderia sp. GAS448]